MIRRARTIATATLCAAAATTCVVSEAFVDQQTRRILENCIASPLVVDREEQPVGWLHSERDVCDPTPMVMKEAAWLPAVMAARTTRFAGSTNRTAAHILLPIAKMPVHSWLAMWMRWFHAPTAWEVVSRGAPLFHDHGRAFIGFQAASQKVFGRPSADVTLAEAALLVAMLERPSSHDPFRHPEAARAARDRLLMEFRDAGGAPSAVNLALASPMPREPAAPPEREVTAYLGVLNRELEGRVATERVTANIDQRLQAATVECFEKQSAILSRLLNPAAFDTLRVAGVVLDIRSGELLAAHTHGAETLTNANERHPAGSAIKTLLFAWALSEGVGTSDILPNRPRRFYGGGVWVPRNLHDDAPVSLTLQDAFVSSQNVAAVELLERLGGAEAFREVARQAGFDASAWPAELGLALGQGEVTVLEMARLAATVLGDGRLASGAARAGTTPPRPQIFAPSAVKALKALMAEAAERGTAVAASQQARRGQYTGSIYAKTGTSDGGADLWVIGGTDDLATAYWIGTAHRTSTRATAADVAAPLWGEWIARLERVRRDGR